MIIKYILAGLVLALTLAFCIAAIVILARIENEETDRKVEAAFENAVRNGNR